MLLPPETTLRVRLVAPLKLRIARTAKDLGLDEREAKQKVESTDLQRCEFVRQHFHKDPEDVTLYDLTINTSRFSVGESAELIVAALERLQLSVPAPSS